MADVPEQVEEAFAALMRGVEGVNSADDHEPGPEGLSKLPTVTMIYVGSKRIGQFTGNAEELEHTWEVFLYVPLKNFRTAQRQIRDLVVLLLDAMRPVVLPGSEKSHLVDDLKRPQFYPKSSIAVKELKLTATATHV